MNCKQGDFAVIVRATTDKHIIGKIVTCVRIDSDYQDAWVTEPQLFGLDGAELAISDSGMRPIRDNDGEDETLQWAPVPTKETA